MEPLNREESAERTYSRLTRFSTGYRAEVLDFPWTVIVEGRLNSGGAFEPTNWSYVALDGPSDSQPQDDVRLQRVRSRVMRAITLLRGGDLTAATSELRRMDRDPAYPDAHWRSVARLFHWAELKGRRPKDSIADVYLCSEAAAEQWIKMCKRKGLLPRRPVGRPSKVSASGAPIRDLHETSISVPDLV